MKCLQDVGMVGGGVARAIESDSCLEVTSSIVWCTSTMLSSAAIDSSKESSRGKSGFATLIEVSGDGPRFENENLVSDALTQPHVSDISPKPSVESRSPSFGGCVVLADALLTFASDFCVNIVV
jgi:hypothetical protein